MRAREHFPNMILTFLCTEPRPVSRNASIDVTTLSGQTGRKSKSRAQDQPQLNDRPRARRSIQLAHRIRSPKEHISLPCDSDATRSGIGHPSNTGETLHAQIAELSMTPPFECLAQTRATVIEMEGPPLSMPMLLQPTHMRTLGSLPAAALRFVCDCSCFSVLTSRHIAAGRCRDCSRLGCK